jgi:hypothetical protein
MSNTLMEITFAAIGKYLLFIIFNVNGNDANTVNVNVTSSGLLNQSSTFPSTTFGKGGGGGGMVYSGFVIVDNITNYIHIKMSVNTGNVNLISPFQYSYIKIA